MRHIARTLIVVSSAASALLAGLWATLALWYRLPLFDPGKLFICVAYAALCLACLTITLRRRSYVAALVLAVAIASVVVWWSTLAPPATADWSPDVARQVTGRIDGDRLTLDGVRDFEWRSNTDFTEGWKTREYDLGQLASVDLFMSYWSGPYIAHMILSFGFKDGQYLAWSVEVRRRRGGAFSPIADLFKSNPLVIIAAEERDVIGVRSNIRGEDVQLFRTNLPPPVGRDLLLAYVQDANELAAAPRWYNSITTNCTTAVVSMMRALGDVIPFDWRLYVNGYVPNYVYARGVLDTGLPMSRLREAAHIDARAGEFGLAEGFSDAIRVGVPSQSNR
ncbi:uncharacterized protein DUF4105 [Neorhizobium alkalisoli]|uniref:Uncharacterized protein DUF4105 n=1 Tax=Neorhizobium alkalisoli TaxID=528178 RepID=A0A561Q0X2_9HYPH|nr:DUF4105 domain-containing protein [Neorhizobium alkalisoli]TWF43989.1 uncharacterized protein DUF4105 [Neorhizobium alkalisoli]